MSHLPSLHWAVTATQGRCHQNHNLKKGGTTRLEWDGVKRGNGGKWQRKRKTHEFRFVQNSCWNENKKYQRLGTKTKSDAGLRGDEWKTNVINEGCSHPGETNLKHFLSSGVCVIGRDHCSFNFRHIAVGTHSNCSGGSDVHIHHLTGYSRTSSLQFRNEQQWLKILTDETIQDEEIM